MAITLRHVWSYLVEFIMPFPVSICVMFWVACLWSIDVSLRPYLLKVILNRLAESSPETVFLQLALPIMLYIGMYILVETSFRLYGYFVEIKMIPRMREKIADDALGRLIDKSHSYYQYAFSGDLTNKVNDLIRSGPELIQLLIDRFFSNALALTFAIITLGRVHHLFALCLLLWTTLCIIGALLFSQRLTRQAAYWSSFNSIITGKIVDVLSNILSVRLFTAKKEEKKALSHTFQEAVKAEQTLQWSYLLMWSAYCYSFVILQMFNFYFLCKGRQEGWVTIGDFALVLTLNISIIGFLWHLAQELSNFTRLYGRLTQALGALWDKPEIEDKKDAYVLSGAQGQITFQDVTFGYKDSEPLFRNLSVTIPAGQKVGLVGYSGGGKTTFVNLILRLYDVTQGRILIDGHDIRDITQESLRYAIAMIPQDPSLFHRSLKDNIRYGKADATDAEVIRASQKAHAHEFISTLPQGYDTPVGERGVRLSGGQRQRIAIARALLKNAPILVLDEATSQLDSVTESKIQDSLWGLMQDKTTLVIAHRLSTLLEMDRILVFDQGKIVEDGTPGELLTKNGLYKTLWNAQVGGFLPDKKHENH